MPQTTPDIELSTRFAVALQGGHDLYWWHRAVIGELMRLRDLDMPAYNVKGLASNLQMSAVDVVNYVDQLVAAGALEDAPAVFEYPARWVALTGGAF